MEATETVVCSLLAVDLTDYCYRVCSGCQKVISSDNNGLASSSLCIFCNSKQPKLLYQILMSIATATSVKTVICFDRAATVLFSCSADEFFHFTKLNPLAASMVNQVFDGEMRKDDIDSASQSKRSTHESFFNCSFKIRFSACNCNPYSALCIHYFFGEFSLTKSKLTFSVILITLDLLGNTPIFL